MLKRNPMDEVASYVAFAEDVMALVAEYGFKPTARKRTASRIANVDHRDEAPKRKRGRPRKEQSTPTNGLDFVTPDLDPINE